MKKIVLTFGIIAGLICGGLFFLMQPGADGEIDFANGYIYGYVTMIIALSTIFFAVKQYRDQHNKGVIKFGKAFMIGIYVTLVAGVVYVISWELYYNYFASNFMDLYIEYLENEMVKEGKSAAVIAEEMAPSIELMERYKNSRPFRMVLTFMEILPVGLLISLLSALVFGIFLKKKPPTASAAT